MFEGRRCWWQVVQLLRNQHLCRQSFLQFESSCFANSRHIRRDVALCQSMLLHYDVHVNDHVAHEQASIVTWGRGGRVG